MTTRTVFALASILALLLAAGAAAQTRSPWQMHDGIEVTPGNPLGLLAFSCSPAIHGDVCEYDVATIPPAGDPGWGPAPDPDIIDFSIPSRVCSAPVICFGYGDFTYFQTMVDIPSSFVVTLFTIDFSGMDDGSRVSIFNSSYPTGLVVPGSYVFLGGSGTADLAAYVVSGEVNRVVITQVDDCCSANNLRSAVVNINGSIVSTGCAGPADCDDGDACTADTCNPDGSCSHVFACPDCSLASASVGSIWPPNHKMVPLEIDGVTDPLGQPLAITIVGISQDEPLDTYGDGHTCPDADGVGSSVARVRAERSGTLSVPGNGRVYHVSYTATSPMGFACSGVVTVCVPHDQGGRSDCVDEGPLHDSTTCP